MKKNRASRGKAVALFFCLFLVVLGPNLLSRLSQKVNHLEDDFASCTNTIIEEVPSPNGSYVATLFERECTLTDSIPHIILKPATEKFKESDYLDNLDDIIYSEDRWTGDILLKWQTSNHLVISVSEKAKRDLEPETHWQNVRISFR